MTHSYIELGPEHVGKSFIKAFDRVWMVTGFIGRVLPEDVGKRVYLVDGHVQVENDEQRDRRQVENDEQRDRRQPTLREASEIVGTMKLMQADDRNAVRALIMAEQALNILATLEESLHLREPVSFSRTETVEGLRWTATRGPITHHGVSLADALGQLCQVLAMENPE